MQVYKYTTDDSLNNYTDFDLASDYKLLFDLCLFFGIKLEKSGDTYTAIWEQGVDEFQNYIKREVHSTDHSKAIIMAIMAIKSGNIYNNFSIKISLSLLIEITECIANCELDPIDAYVYMLETIIDE